MKFILPLDIKPDESPVYVTFSSDSVANGSVPAPDELAPTQYEEPLASMLPHKFILFDCF